MRLARQERNHEVVLVVAGHRREHVHVVEWNLAQVVDLTGIGEHPPHPLWLARGLGPSDALGFHLDDRDVVAASGQLRGDEGADVATSDDDDLHE